MLSIVLPIAFTLPLPQQPAGSVTRALPLQHLCRQSSPQPVPQWGTLLVHSGGDDFLGVNSMAPVLSSGDVPNILERYVGTAIEEDRLWLHATDSGSLLAVGDAADVAIVERILTEVDRVLNRSLQVEFAVWDARDRNAPDTILDAQQYARFAADRRPLWRALNSTLPGRGVGVDQMRWTRYVRGINVEVAEKQTINNPVTALYGQGGSVAVQAFSLIGSDELAVHAQFAVGHQRGTVRTVQTGLPGSADIDLPRLESYFAICSGRIPSGGALAVSMRGDASTGGDIVMTVRVTAGPTHDLRDATAAILPVGALTTGASRLRDVSGIRLQATSPRLEREFDERFAYGHLSASILVDLVNSALEQGSDDDYVVDLHGGFLFLRASEAGIARVTELLRGLQDELVQNLELHHEATLHDAPADSGPHPQLYELTLPTLVGREAMAVRVLETNAITDVYCEIAAEAGSLSPQVRPLQAGTWLQVSAVPTANGFDLDLAAQTITAPTPTLRTVMPAGGVLMTTQTDTISRSFQGTVALDQRIDHGDGPRVAIDGRPYHSRIATTVRR